MLVTKQFEWCMGHRVLNHKSKCKNLHGHHYRAEITLSGDLVSREGDSSEGMVIDFGDIKEVFMKHIHEILDHGFMVWEKDNVLMEFFSKNFDQKHTIVPFIPTAENIAMWVFEQLEPKFIGIFSTNLKLESVKIWETPTSMAIYQKL